MSGPRDWAALVSPKMTVELARVALLRRAVLGLALQRETRSCPSGLRWSLGYRCPRGSVGCIG